MCFHFSPYLVLSKLVSKPPHNSAQFSAQKRPRTGRARGMHVRTEGAFISTLGEFVQHLPPLFQAKIVTVSPSSAFTDFFKNVNENSVELMRPSKRLPGT